MKRMLEKGRLSTKQLSVLVIFSVIGESLLVIPSSVAEEAKQDAWISGLIGMTAGLLIAWMIFRIGQTYGPKTLIEHNRALLGRWAGGTVSVLYLLYFLINISALIREIGDFITTQFLPETPLRAVHLIIVILIIWAVKSGLETLARAGEVFFPLFAVLLISMFVFLLPQFHSDRLQPMLGQGIPSILRGSLFIFAFPFCELIVLLMIFPYVAHNPKLQKDYMLAVLFGGLTICLLILISILVLGPNLSAYHSYASYAIAQKISIGHFVERLEALLAVNWIVSTYYKISLFYYGLILGSAQLFNLRDYRQLTVPTGMIVFGLAFIISPNIVYFNAKVSYWVIIDILFALLIPALLFFIGLTRRKKRLKRPASAEK
ncbi:spore gernimation protein [Paenibacillus contaminans]|uniref:Spore gernimation protein n=2 Tax=Paenibacillus contaminans TaxID=450362 RepID=A0A329M7N5_9BACL|nr:spore gernimation protein [Paenibacillus contaminans]